MSKAKIMMGVKKYTMIIVLILITIFFAIATEGNILKSQNISNIIAQNAYVFVLSTGMLLCILTGGNIDLSVGSVACFVGAIGAVLMESLNFNPIIAVILMLAIGALIGAWQGFWIAFVRVPPFIVTLAGMLIFRGLSNVVLQGQTVSLKKSPAFISLFGGGANCYIPDFLDFMNLPDFNMTSMIMGIVACLIYVIILIRGRVLKAKKGYEMEPLLSTIVKSGLIIAAILTVTFKISQYRGIPTALIWVIIVVVIYGYITSKTTTGRYFYAVGGNEKATKLSGINTNKVYFIAYMNMGFLAALAGMLMIARMTSAQPTYGQNYEMDAIGACFIGGASAYGGVGTVPGVIVGAVLMGVINIGMSIMGVDANYQKVVKGLVLLLAVIFDVVTKKADK